MEMEKTVGETGLWQSMKGSVLDVVNLRCLWELQSKYWLVFGFTSLEFKGEIMARDNKFKSWNYTDTFQAMGLYDIIQGTCTDRKENE